MMNKPQVSIIIATHNRDHLLPKAVDSIINQSWQDFEIIIVDDCSSDNTAQAICDLERKDPRIHSIRSEQNIGPGAARNLGILKAQGENIAIMDDDDFSLPQRLEIQMEVLKREPAIGLVCSVVEYINKETVTVGYSSAEPNGKPFPENPEDVFVRLYLEGSIIMNPTIMARRRVWEEFKYPKFPWDAEDRFLFMQMAAKGVRMKLIKQPLVRMLQDPKHESLTRIAYQKRIPAKRLILKLIKNWLKTEGINEFNHYHKTAMSNQYLRESLHYKTNIQALLLTLRAFVMDPTNPDVIKRFQSYILELKSRLKLVV